MKKFTLFFVFMFAGSVSLSQSLSISNIDTSSYPVLTAGFFAFDSNGKQIVVLSLLDNVVTENGSQRKVISVSCPVEHSPNRLSSVIVIDVSGSMTGSPLIIAKTYVNALPLGQSDCAVTSFYDGNYFNQDFTTNRNKLISTIDDVGHGGGTDYNKAMIEPIAGGILVAKMATHQRVIIFITDGQPNQNPNESRIISEAKANNITIHCITIGLPSHTSMKNFAVETCGLLFENLSTENEAIELAKRISIQSTNASGPCEVSCESGYICKSDLINCNAIANNLSSIFHYLAPFTSISKLIFSPSGVYFQNKPIGIKADTIITVTAINADFTISKIISSDPNFSISPSSFSIKAGQTINLTLSFTPTDSNWYYSTFNIENDKCNYIFDSIGGIDERKKNKQTLKLTHPNGGEVFLVGSDTIITWVGVFPNDTVKLEYSLDNGASWNLITDKASGLKYYWKELPDTISNKCLIKVMHKGKITVPRIEWEKSYGGGKNEIARSIQQTFDGGYIVAGFSRSYNGDVSGHHGTNVSTSDYWIVKLSPEGSNRFQKDVSDSVFSIVKPQITSLDIDMGKVNVGAFKDSVITKFIKNTGSYECKIKDIQLSGVNAADFYVVSNRAFTLKSGETRAIEFLFQPGAIGKRDATIAIITQADTLFQSITGEGVLPQIQVLTKIVDFGTIEAGYKKDSLIYLIKNLSPLNIDISSTKLLGPDLKQFEIISGGGAFSLAPGGSRELSLIFKPVYNGRTSCELAFYFNGTGSPARTQLYGRGIGGSVYCTNDSAYAGVTKILKLMLGGVKANSIQKLASKYKVKMQFQKTILAPTNNALIKGFGTDSTFLEFTGNLTSDSVLYNLEVTAGLGNTESTSIDITEFKWLDENDNEIDYETETESGIFTLLGLCREGRTRLDNPECKAGILNLAPNPANDEISITVNTIEEGDTRLILYNSMGIEVSRLNVETLTSGKKVSKLNLDECSTGVYFIKYQTPTWIEYEKIVVGR